jgi:FAD/FMN-containing dehydrogenase
MQFDTQNLPLLPADRLERLASFGMVVSADAFVFRPSTLAGIQEVFALARESKRPLTLRGAGRSYGDASLNPEGIVLDVTRFNRILAWNPATGEIECESGVTVGQLWQYVVGDGWWPPVVSGTMFPTLGGALGANIHGKNNFTAGTLGDHVAWFELLTPRGELLRCSRTENADVFHAAIGGLGLLGCFTRIALTMKRVHSGYLDVVPYASANLGDMLTLLDERAMRRAGDEAVGRELRTSPSAQGPAADYLVGWIDTFAAGAALGRGIVHEARYLPEGADPAPAQSLRLETQNLPDTLFGFLPKSMLWMAMWLFLWDLGWRFVCWVKWVTGKRQLKPYRQTHAAFAFLLDYVPNWKWSYKPGGLIQFQSFVPRDKAAAVFAEQLRLSHAANLTPYLGVVKRHRPDEFLLSHGVDGYSLALDFRVTQANRERLWVFLQALADGVVRGGGRFYLAKDAVLTKGTYEASLPPGTLRAFRALKEKHDPGHVLAGALYHRLFA